MKNENQININLPGGQQESKRKIIKLSELVFVFMTSLSLPAIILAFGTISWIPLSIAIPWLNHVNSFFWISLFISIIAFFLIQLFYFAQFREISFEPNHDATLLRRLGSNLTLKSTEIRLFKIYPLSLFQRTRWSVDLSVHTYDVTFLLKIETNKKSFFFFIPKEQADKLERYVEKGKLEIPNFQIAEKKFNQAWYWLILLVAIFLIFGIGLFVLYLSRN
jgi:hypothetical protein